MAPPLGALDCFRFCRCLRAVGARAMLAVVLGLTAWIAATTVRSGLAPTLGDASASAGKRAAFGVLAFVYAAAVGMMVWSYLACALTDPGRVPPGWAPFPPPDAEAGRGGGGAWAAAGADDPGALVFPPGGAAFSHEADEYTLPAAAVVAGGAPAAAASSAAAAAALEAALAALPPAARARAYLERPRRCRRCAGWKPPRAHHCSAAGRCVLRMDHYCVWVGATVGLLNYKAFLLFLAYAEAACALSAGLLAPPTAAFFAGPAPGSDVGAALGAFVACVFCAAFALALAGFLAVHARLVAAGQTTVEAFEKPEARPWPYDRGGLGRNARAVFGRAPRRWALPTLAPGERRAALAAELAVPPSAGESPYYYYYRGVEAPAGGQGPAGGAAAAAAAASAKRHQRAGGSGGGYDWGGGGGGGGG